jgi:hypothetical protein
MSLFSHNIELIRSEGREQTAAATVREELKEREYFGFCQSYSEFLTKKQLKENCFLG